MYTTSKQVQHVIDAIVGCWLEDRPITVEGVHVATGLSHGVLRQVLLQLQADGRLIVAPDMQAGERHLRPAGLQAAQAAPAGGFTLAHVLEPYLADPTPTPAEKAKVRTAVREALAVRGCPARGKGDQELLRAAAGVPAGELRSLPALAASRQPKKRGADNMRYAVRVLLRYGAARALVPVLCEYVQRDAWDEWVMNHAPAAPRPHEFISVLNSLRRWQELTIGKLRLGLTPAMLSSADVEEARDRAVQAGLYKPASARAILSALKRFGRDLGVGPFADLADAPRARGGARGTTPVWWLQTMTTTPGIDSLVSDCTAVGLPSEARDFAQWVWRFHSLTDAEYAQSVDMPTPRLDPQKAMQTMNDRLRAIRAAWGALLAAGHTAAALTPEYVLATHGDEMLALVAERLADSAANTRRNVFAGLSVLAGLALVWRRVQQALPGRLRIRTPTLRAWYNGIATWQQSPEDELAYLGTRTAATKRAEHAGHEAAVSRETYVNAVPMIQMAWVAMADVLQTHERQPNAQLTKHDAEQLMVLTAMAIASLGATRIESIALLRLDRHANDAARKHAAPHLRLDGAIQKYARGLLSATHYVPLTQGLDRLLDLYLKRARPVLLGDATSPYVFIAPSGKSYGDEEHDGRTDRGAQALSRHIQSLFAELLVKHGHEVPTTNRALGPHQTRNDVATMGVKRNVPSERIDIVLLNHKPENQTDKSYLEKDPEGVTALLHDIFRGHGWWDALAPGAAPPLSLGQQQRLDALARRVFVRCDATPEDQRELASYGPQAITAAMTRVMTKQPPAHKKVA
jgi:hypothetical protein